MSSSTCRPLLSSPISIHSLIIISLSVIEIQQKDEILKNHTFKKEQDQNTISFFRLLSVQKIILIIQVNYIKRVITSSFIL